MHAQAVGRERYLGLQCHTLQRDRGRTARVLRVIGGEVLESHLQASCHQRLCRPTAAGTHLLLSVIILAQLVLGSAEALVSALQALLYLCLLLTSPDAG